MNFNFENYQEFGMPEHKLKIDENFLIWLIGFYEGDGYITEWFEKGRYRLRIGLSQKDPVLLWKIRTELGFGKVVQRKIDENTFFWEYYVEDKMNIIRLIHLLNGNLVLEKRKEQFEKMLEHWNRANETNPFVFNDRIISFDLSDAWLSGFSEAEAGFDGNWTRDFKNQQFADGSTRYAIKLKFYLTQKLDKDDKFLVHVANLFGVLKPRIYLLQNIRQNNDSNENFIYYRLEFNTAASHDKLVTYFKKFPLKGHRRFQYQRFAMLRNRQLIRGSQIKSEKEAKRIARALTLFVNQRREREIRQGQF